MVIPLGSALDARCDLIPIDWLSFFRLRFLAIEGSRQLLQRRGNVDRVGRCRPECLKMGRQASEFVAGALSGVGECRQRGDSLAGANHGSDQRFAGLRVVFEGQDIRDHRAVVVDLAIDLLSARPCRLAFRAFALRAAVLCLKLVRAVECRRICEVVRLVPIP